MPLFGKKDDKKDGEGLSQKEIDAFKSKNADLIASDSPSEPTAIEQPAAEEPAAQPENSSDAPEAAAPSDGDAPSDGPSSDSSGGEAEAGDGESGEAEAGDASAGLGEDALSDDLMSLFTSEEDVDDDLEALTKDLRGHERPGHASSRSFETARRALSNHMSGVGWQ